MVVQKVDTGDIQSSKNKYSITLVIIYSQKFPSSYHDDDSLIHAVVGQAYCLMDTLTLFSDQAPLIRPDEGDPTRKEIPNPTSNRFKRHNSINTKINTSFWSSGKFLRLSALSCFHDSNTIIFRAKTSCNHNERCQIESKLIYRYLAHVFQNIKYMWNTATSLEIHMKFPMILPTDPCRTCRLLSPVRPVSMLKPNFLGAPGAMDGPILAYLIRDVHKYTRIKVHDVFKVDGTTGYPVSLNVK